MMSLTGPQIAQFVQRKFSESELARSNAHNLAILESVNDSIVTTNQKGIITSHNSQTKIMFHVDDMNGKDINLLIDNFSIVFIQEGKGTVTIQQSGTATLLYPSITLQNIIKGQYYWAMVEKKLATNTYYLLGSLLPV